jgi:hypothetical protein
VVALETKAVEEQIVSRTEEEVAKEDVATPVVDVREEILVKKPQAKETAADAIGTSSQRDTAIEEVSKAAAVVDARHCAGLNYRALMRGRITFREVWNGHEFVTQKVCVVDEGDGVCSFWSFEQGPALVTEVRADSEALKDGIADASKPKR